MKPFEALLCIAASLTGLMTLGPLLVQHLGLVGIILSEAALVGLPAVAFLQARGLPVIDSLGLRRPRLPALLGGVLAGAGGFWLVALLEVLLERWWPVPAEVKESLRHFVAGRRFILWDVLALAAAPAVCEEALFRGLAQPSFRRLGGMGAVLLTALLFAGFHLSWYRFLPTALLGVLLGLLREKSGSLWPPMLFHAVNNTLVLVLVRGGRDSPPPPTTVGGIAGLSAAVIALTVGVGLVFRSSQRR